MKIKIMINDSEINTYVFLLEKKLINFTKTIKKIAFLDCFELFFMIMNLGGSEIKNIRNHH